MSDEMPSRTVSGLAFVAAEIEARIAWAMRGDPSFDVEKQTGPFTTLVAYLPAAFAEEVASAIALLPGSSSHYRYPPAQLHITLRNLDGVDLSGLAEIVGDQEAMQLLSGRLRFTRDTLLLPLFPTNGALVRFRSDLRRLPGGKLRRPKRLVAFANLLRLNGPIRQIQSTVRADRDRFVNRTIRLNEVTLVRTDKVGTPERTEILARYQLTRHTRHGADGGEGS